MATFVDITMQLYPVPRYVYETRYLKSTQNRSFELFKAFDCIYYGKLIDIVLWTRMAIFVNITVQLHQLRPNTGNLNFEGSFQGSWGYGCNMVVFVCINVLLCNPFRNIRTELNWIRNKVYRIYPK